MPDVIAPVVSVGAVHELTGSAASYVLADVRWYLDGRDGHAAFEQAHLPGAVWVDLDRQLPRTAGPPARGATRSPPPTRSLRR
jgi:thiosulfate/3-mercaptopyruvate sulfurtransferase